MTPARKTQVDPARMQFLVGEVRGRTVAVVTFRLPGCPRVCEYVYDREEAKQIYRDALAQAGALNFPDAPESEGVA